VAAQLLTIPCGTPLLLQARRFVPCSLCGVQTRVNLIDDKLEKTLELTITAMVVALDPALYPITPPPDPQTLPPGSAAAAEAEAEAARCLLPRGLALCLWALGARGAAQGEGQPPPAGGGKAGGLLRPEHSRHASIGSSASTQEGRSREVRVCVWLGVGGMR
jgi:hypothetical protein